MHARRGAHVVTHLGEHVWFDAAAKIESFVIALRLFAEVVAPKGSCGARAEDVGKLNGIAVGYDRSAEDRLSVTPTIAGLVEPKLNLVEVDVHEICATSSVQICKKQTFRIEVDIEARRVLHRDTFAETAVTEVGPVVDAGVVN